MLHIHVDLNEIAAECKHSNAQMHERSHPFSEGDEASVHDVPIQTFSVSEHTTSGHQIALQTRSI